MASRNILKPFYVFTNQQMTTSSTSPATNLEVTSCISYDLQWTGAPVGTFQVQVSNTYVPSAAPGNLPNNPGNWITIPSTNFQGNYPTPSGTPSNGALDIDVTGFTWIRLVYTATSGTGSLTAVIAGKNT